MSQPRSEPIPTRINITIADDSALPIYHVNAIDLRSSTDEFFFTLGVVQPPNQTEMATVTEAGHVVAQPIVRFAISRDTMEQFLALMAGQFDQQTTLIKRSYYLGEETDKEGASSNE